MKIFQQLNSQGFWVSETVNYDWAGAIDAPKPDFDKASQKAKWDYDTQSWIVKSIEDWNKELNQDGLEE